MSRLGIIGGTGLYAIDDLKDVQSLEVETPFGKPSAPIVSGRLGEQDVLFLPRHGAHHEHLPFEINYRANIWALKQAGARSILSVSATGSLEEEIRPGDLAIPDQYLDFTKGIRKHTYFGNGIAAHISTAEPSCREMADELAQAAEQEGVSIHRNKTYACVEGPRLGTRAESFFLRNSGCHLVGMTNIPEVFLAREAQLSYTTIAIATDYDCWMDDPEQHANVEVIMARYRESLGQVLATLRRFCATPRETLEYTERKTLEGSILTPDNQLNEQQRQIVDFLRL